MTPEEFKARTKTLELEAEELELEGEVEVTPWNPTQEEWRTDRSYDFWQASMVVDSIESGLRTLIVETHSEHLILRILRRIRETTRGTAPPDRVMTPKELSILFTQQAATTGSEVRRIHVDVNGEFVEPWPDKFFDQDTEERFA